MLEELGKSSLVASLICLCLSLPKRYPLPEEFLCLYPCRVFGTVILCTIVTVVNKTNEYLKVVL